MEVGGIRISHMSHIEADTIVVLTATKKARKPFTVKPLILRAKSAPAVSQNSPQNSEKTPEQRAREWTDATLINIASADEDALHAMAGDAEFSKRRDWLSKNYPTLDAEIADAMKARLAEVSDFPGDRG